ncbi:MAG: GNAT family N-acetyltransferase [Rhodobacteraceae bacterium]|nr:GNAT family N-acetyltransferase [Paracoccaceae bacterium]
MSERTIAIRVLNAIEEIDPDVWDRCATPGTEAGGRPESPFTTHRFLLALEASGSATAETGWAPHHLVAQDDCGGVIGVAPLYAKTHSQGEFVFDYGWADAFMRAGGRYYPKLQCSAPFTPASGRRLLARADAGIPAETIELALVQGACQLAQENDLSSLHITFCTEGEWTRLGAAGLLQRQDQQFHWENKDYASFDDFLASLASRKRKQVRKERERALESGVEIVTFSGDDLKEEHWRAFWRFYQDTGSRKWGSPYLTRDFYRQAQKTLRDDIALVMCRREGEWIAGALNFIGRETLYGRYWGCVEDHPCLHFEACYYQAIDIAIRMGLKRVEAGAQGAHKLARGYLPAATYSVHWIANPQFRHAVETYLDHERAAVADEIELLSEHSPFKKES